MNGLDGRVSMAEIARLAEVKPAAVSNWRRRHPDFPTPENLDGPDLFLVADVAAWLEHRKIAKNDIKDGEPGGFTYGARFQANFRKWETPTKGPADHLNPALGRDTTASFPSDSPEPLTNALTDTLWRELQRSRSTTDPSAHADLVLSMLYLRACNGSQWTKLVDATKRLHLSDLGAQVESAWLTHTETVPRLRDALPQVWTEIAEKLPPIIHILDRVGLRGTNRTDSPASIPAGLAYRFLLERFATAEGIKGGEFLTPDSLVRLMVRVTDPQPTERIYDPCCGAGTLLVGANTHARRHPDTQSLRVFGQALSERSCRIAMMNLAVHGIASDLGSHARNLLRQDSLQENFDVILTNPPFNMSDWNNGYPIDDLPWQYGEPPKHNANFAWLQHIALRLSPQGRAAVLMANGASSSKGQQEHAIRAGLVEDGLVECLIALPPKLFHSTMIPVTLWLLRHRPSQENREVLFIDATTFGTMEDRTHRILTDDNIDRISGAYDDWRTRSKSWLSGDAASFSRSATLHEIRERAYSLNPREYVAMQAGLVDANHNVETLNALRRELEFLHLRAIEIDTMVDQKLNEVQAWRL